MFHTYIRLDSFFFTKDLRVPSQTNMRNSVPDICGFLFVIEQHQLHCKTENWLGKYRRANTTKVFETITQNVWTIDSSESETSSGFPIFVTWPTPRSSPYEEKALKISVSWMFAFFSKWQPLFRYTFPTPHTRENQFLTSRIIIVLTSLIIRQVEAHWKSTT